ncbi:MAG: DUF2231 domain-containing protein [Candidatus Eremiobacteraeota bacterium]|nr:DUF2231 domain-containing protein [Candidatus Eremiobacteraeota bacterium]
MQGKATIAGHPIHPILITVPIGCYVAALVSDIVFAFTHAAFWGSMSTWLVGFGIAGSLIAAFFGLVDYLSAPMTAQARTIANWHATLNSANLVVFLVAFAVRYLEPSSILGHVALVAGILLLVPAGVLGGKLAHNHLVGSSENDLGRLRVAADETQLTPHERLARDREIARSSRRGTV